MSIAAIIVAAGRGQRAGGADPKQWRVLCGRPLISHTLDAFRGCPAIARIVVVINDEDRTSDNLDWLAGCTLAQGGATRAASVRMGLKVLEETDTDRVLIHDAARPCVSRGVIEAVIGALGSHRAAAPALPVTDALWTGENNLVTGIRQREGLYRAQTPQGFDFATILGAHQEHAGDAADDVEVVRALGVNVAMVPGDEDNMKVTLPGDFARAERILRGQDGYPVGKRV